jgi:zinc protease
MEDLSAASLEDVKNFFRTYYAPNNACLVIAGDINLQQTKEWVEKYFGRIPKGKEIQRPVPQPFSIKEDKRMVFEDKVQLPRLFVYWASVPMNTHEDAVLDLLADIAAGGKSSRFYKSLVFEKQIAQSVSAEQDGMEIAGSFGYDITAKPGKSLKEIEASANELLDKIVKDGVTEKEIQAAINSREASIINRMATALGKTNLIATYYTLTGDANNVNKQLERYKGITPAEVQAAAKKVLATKKVVLSIVPEGKVELAAEGTLLNQKGGAK